jgi:hypothetical protein
VAETPRGVMCKQPRSITVKIDTQKNLDIVWAALEAYRADLIPEGDEMYDKIWNEVCTAMHYIAEDLGCPEQVDD